MSSSPYSGRRETQPLPEANGLAGIPALVAGFFGLIIAMGVGRFAYTVILPDMMRAYGFDETVAGVMAGWNYAGYLFGALAMRNEKPGMRRYLFLVVWLTLSVATTGGMGLVCREWAWHGIRFLSGLASGGIFVLCSAIVFDALQAVQRTSLAGFLYSGVGTGIALGGLAAPLLESRFGPAGAWLGLAFVCLPLGLFTIFHLHPQRAPCSVPGRAFAQTAAPARPASGKGEYPVLLVAYFLEGFGYIIGTTFLVAFLAETTQSPALAEASWVVTGCTAALFTPLWRIAATRNGYLPMLILAFALQGVGVLLPVLSSSAVAGLCSGLLLGGTFLGITALSLQYGVSLSGKPSAHTIATMTVLYGVGQIIGPLVAGLTASDGAGFGFSFVVSSVSLFAAVLVLLPGYLRSKASRATANIL